MIATSSNLMAGVSATACALRMAWRAPRAIEARLGDYTCGRCSSSTDIGYVNAYALAYGKWTCPCGGMILETNRSRANRAPYIKTEPSERNTR